MFVDSWGTVVSVTSVLQQIYEYIVSYELWFRMWYEWSSEYLDPWKTLEEKERSNLADYGIVIFVVSQCGYGTPIFVRLLTMLIMLEMIAYVSK